MSNTFKQFVEKYNLGIVAEHVDNRPSLGFDKADSQQNRDAIHFKVKIVMNPGRFPNNIVWEGYCSVVSGYPAMWARKNLEPSKYNKMYPEDIKSLFCRKAPLDIVDILSCIRGDCIDGSYTFQAFCDEYGYNTNSRTVFNIYLECQDTLNKMRSGLGYSAYNDFMQCIDA